MADEQSVRPQWGNGASLLIEGLTFELSGLPLALGLSEGLGIT